MASFIDDAGGMTEEEAKLYDRQIRLWGVEAQNRMQKSRILICGLTGMHAEVVKNIVLAGISVVIQDDKMVRYDDLASNFFLTPEDIGCPRNGIEPLQRIQDLNPLTKVAAEVRTVSELPDNYFHNFSVVVISSEVSETDAIRINKCVRAADKGGVFFYGGSFGTEGWFVCDYGAHFEYKDDPPNNHIIKTAVFPTLECVLNTPWKSLISRHFPLNETYVKARILNRYATLYKSTPGVDDVAAVTTLTHNLLMENGCDENFLTNDSIQNMCICNQAMVAVITSVVGGFLAQEVMKGVSRVGKPMQNVFVFSGVSVVAKAFPACMPTQPKSPTVPPLTNSQAQGTVQVQTDGQKPIEL